MLKDLSCRIVENRSCGRDLYILRLQTDGTPFECRAGQFVMLDLPDPRFFFRRPFSVLEVLSPTELAIFYKVVGRGTQMMADLEPGDTMRCLGPLGNAFTLPDKPEKVLLVGGGIGIAPLYLMGTQLNAAGAERLPICVYGTRSAQDLGLEQELTTLFGPERLWLATDDCSAGFAGNVCGLLESRAEALQDIERAYVCGPTPMMRATVELLTRLNPAIQVEVSLEEHMPCGTGACTGCVVPRADQFLPSKVCTEGPVFPAPAIRWRWAEPAACSLSQITQATEVASCPS